jgi:hypothetical protein
MKLADQVFVSHEKPVARKINAPTNEKFWKPNGGLWTSTLTESGGQWVEWLENENYPLDDPRWGGKLWRLRPTDANIAVIAAPPDLRELAASYPLALDAELRKIKSFEHLIDWEAFALDYDAMHVPNPWPWRFTLDDYDTSMFFYTMDAECTCWFRWCFEGRPEVVDLASLTTV